MLSWPKHSSGKDEGINFQLHPPTSPKFTITFTPSQGTVKKVSVINAIFGNFKTNLPFKDKLIEIRAKLVVNMTTEAEVAIGLQLPRNYNTPYYHIRKYSNHVFIFFLVHQVHSYMVFHVIGEMSTFIDFDEIQINRQLIIGDGAYGTVYRGKVRHCRIHFFDTLTRVIMSLFIS